jgi:hypothetical protein
VAVADERRTATTVELPQALAPGQASGRLPELHFHDLRHTGNTMAAAQGASLRELMERMGHSSPGRAHLPACTRERDEAIAAGMGQLLKEARKQGTRPGTSGTRRARRPGRPRVEHQMAEN